MKTEDNDNKLFTSRELTSLVDMFKGSTEDKELAISIIQPRIPLYNHNDCKEFIDTLRIILFGRESNLEFPLRSQFLLYIEKASMGIWRAIYWDKNINNYHKCEE